MFVSSGRFRWSDVSWQPCGRFLVDGGGVPYFYALE